MRIVFMLITVALFQLCAFMVGRGIFWLIQPWLPNARTWVVIATLVVSNLFLATLFLGQFRIALGYLSVLWLGVLTIAAICVINVLCQKLSLANAQVYDVGIRAAALCGFVGLIGMSLYNAYTPTVRHLSIQIDKPMAHPVRLALASDLHLGRMFGVNQLEQLANILKQERAELLLMPGDIMDDNTHVYEAQNMSPAFGSVVSAASSGVVASLGNHDLYDVSSRRAIAEAVRATGAVLLDDQVAVINVGGVLLSLIGRFDDHKTDRKTTEQLLAELPQEAQEYPVILLDHRPSQVDENVQLPIDLQVSGHTHNGQIFPANFIVKILNRVSYGHKEINNTHVIVSSGYGFWGIPFRLGSQSEVWVIELSGKK